MAKALLGHVGGTDMRMIAEVSRLRSRVSELQAQVIRLQAENDALAALVQSDDLMTIAMDEQPALAGSGA